MEHPIFSLVPTTSTGLDYEWLKANGANYGLLVTEDGDNYIVIKMISKERARETLADWWAYRSLFIDGRLNIVICRTLDSGISLDEFSSCYKWDDIVIEEYIEGTQIQVYWDCRNRVWSFGTRGRMDLAHRWSGDMSYQAMFLELVDLDNFVDLLNTDYCYSFALQHPDNYILVPKEIPRLVHIETRNMRTGRCIDVDLGIDKPRRLKLPRDYDDSLGTIWDFIPQREGWGDDFQRYVDTSAPWTTGGYMLWNTDHTVRTHVMPKQYADLRSIMDSVAHSNISYRFMSLIKQERWADIQLLTQSLPELERSFLWANRAISAVIKMIYETYREIYIHRRMIVMTRPQWMARHLLFRIHGIYLDRAKRNETRDIDIFDIIEVLLRRCSDYELWMVCRALREN